MTPGVAKKVIDIAEFAGNSRRESAFQAVRLGRVPKSGWVRLEQMATTILLVDDDPLQAYMCKSLLDKRFADVKRVADAGEALCLVEQPRFASDLALVISRGRLPGIGGPAFVAELHNRMPELPVLVLGDAGEWPVESIGDYVRFMPRVSATDEIVSAAGQMLARSGSMDGSRVA